jgi:hypothetical protein
LLELILGTVRIDPSSFLNKYMGQGVSPLLAAAVSVPDIQTGFNKRVDYPQLPETFPEGQKADYRAVGNFGQFKDAEEEEMYKQAGFASPIVKDRIRGYMDFMPGGIPASEGFDYDKTLKNYPDLMQGIQRGNMPVYRTY